MRISDWSSDVCLPISFLGGSPTNADLQLGGSGTNTERWRNRDEFGLTAEYWLDTDFGTHTFKFGYTDTENTDKVDQRFTGPEAAQYTSISADNAGVTFADYVGGDWTGFVDLAGTDIDRITNAIAASPNSAYFIGQMDTNGNGIVDADEVNAYQFTSTAGNPNGQVNAYRIVQSTVAPYQVQSKGKALYLQDTWTMNKWTVNAGVRAEEWSHFSSAGDNVMTFDWEVAPRLSVVFDLNGDGRSKVWGYMGRYYDPIRTNMTNFAGNLTGSVLDEQIAIGDQWRSEEHTSELQSLMRISYAVFCLKKKNMTKTTKR